MPIDAAIVPKDGLWRVARGPDPLVVGASKASADAGDVGNRFDSPDGSYDVLYFGTTLAGCYGETLARFRPDPRLLAVVEADWREHGFMAVGAVPADWRQRRVVVQVALPGALPFLDVESLKTRQYLRRALGGFLADRTIKDLDVSVVRGGDRHVTRRISHWAHSQTDADGRPVFAGIRYLSRLNTDWECWAVFGRTDIHELARHSIFKTDENLLRVAERFGLRVH